MTVQAAHGDQMANSSAQAGVVTRTITAATAVAAIAADDARIVANSLISGESPASTLRPDFP